LKQVRRLIHAIAGLALVATGAAAQESPRPDEGKTIGTHMPDITLVADDSTTYRLSSLWGKPVIVSPIFVSCPQTCSMITESLRDALAQVGKPGVGYEVLTVSFDPADDAAALRGYRERLDLPPAWRLATASAQDVDTLLGTLDFRVTPMDGGFAHPNLIAILSPDLTVSGYVYGVGYDAEEVGAALQHAARRSSLVVRFRPFILLVALAALLAIAWALFVTRRRQPTAT
jgi:protein SCO1/2